ncbi:MAG: asparagine synthase C-terminal domain-containing protein [Nanoarchaeota archaeon]|nr:asparagine synthase C-terminal domain-containing protein [Nanoarchaeota archaeon]
MKSEQEMVSELSSLVVKSIEKNLPEERFGILFSGGVDSTLIAFVAKKLGKSFTCYTTALEEQGLKKSEDLEYAEKIAKHLGFELKTIKLSLENAEAYIKKTVIITGKNDIVSVGVGATLVPACEQAQKDKVKIIFSGLGSEELFAGYERHEKAKDVNKECLEGLKNIKERDLDRDEAIAKHYNLELKIPFLDKELIDYALKIPGELKIKDGIKKFILRKAAINIGLPEEYAMRKKRAAQYGSRIDNAILKLTKKKGLKYKKEYLESLK